MGLIVFSVGGVSVYLYGIVVIAAILTGMLTAWFYIRLQGEHFAPVVDFLLCGLPMGFIVARLAYICTHWQFYEGHGLDVFRLWQGGISLYGGAAGFLAAMFLCCKWKDLDFWRWLDLLAPAFVIGLAINELGNFATQMTVGTPFPPNLANDHTLAEYIEFKYRPSGFENYEYFRPVALYQMFMQMGLFLLLTGLTIYRAWYKRLSAGIIFLLGVIGLAAIRFGCGFFYLSTEQGMVLHSGQKIVLAIAVLGCILFVWRMRRRRSVFYGRY